MQAMRVMWRHRAAAQKGKGGPVTVIHDAASGFTMHTVAEVLGHQKGDLGLSMTSRYAGRETMAAKAACVRAVKLPRDNS